MPWPKEHKTRTRDRIVRAAATAFRGRGVSGVRVDEIMDDAGLTHGGFYAHFASKDDLLVAALEHASGEMVESQSKRLESVPAERRLRAAIDAYLSAEHAAHPERGCPMAALGPELSRTRGKAQRDLARGVRRRLDWLRQLDARGGPEGGRDEQVAGTLACMVGGLIVARLVGGKEGDEFLQSCRAFLHRTLGEGSPHDASSSAPAKPQRPARRRRSSSPQ